MILTPDEAQSQRTMEVSRERDPERWTLSHTEHTATALRRRVLLGRLTEWAREDLPTVRETVG